MHSGTDHWAVLTNIGIPDQLKDKEAIVYDSLIQLQGKKSCLVKPAVEWQACQLLKKGTSPQIESVVIHTYPCQQQDNGYDCGIFALANAITLAFKKHPEHIIYTGNLRKELMDMLLNGCLSPLQTIAQNGSFTRSTIVANMHLNACLTKMCKRIDVICYCRMPQSYGDLIQCQVCQLHFHQKCFLIGSSAIASKLKKFYCYGCRKIGDYSFIESSWIKPDTEACARVAKEVQKLESNNCSIIARAKSIRTEKMFSSVAQYLHFEQFVIRYDLNRVCSKTGDIFNAMYNFYSNADSPMVEKYPFETLSLSEIFCMAVLLICKVDEVSLPPYVWKETYATLKEAITRNKKWIGVLTSTALKVEKSVKELVESGIKYKDSQDKLSSVLSELASLSIYRKEARNVLQGKYKGSTESEVKKKIDLLAQVNTIESCMKSIHEKMNKYRNM